MHATIAYASHLFQRHQATTARRGDWSASCALSRFDRLHSHWMLTHAATSALVILKFVASVFALTPNRSGRQGETPAFLAMPSQAAATPTAAAGPIAELLWAVSGDQDGRFGMPDGAAIDAQGNLWVTDGANGRLVIISPEGVVRETWGTHGSGEGEFDFTCRGQGYGGVGFDVAGNIYVADAGNGRIQKFAPDRAFLTSWPSLGIVDSQVLVTARGNRSAPKPQDLCPVSIAVDSQGRVYVSDQDAGVISVFDPDGHALATLAVEWMRPEGVALDGAGNIWVADVLGRVLQFAPDGALLATWDAVGSGVGALSTPMGIAVDAQGRVFVSDQSNRVLVFAPDGTFLGAWGQFNDPVTLVLDGVGHIYVVEHYGNRVQKFRLLPPFGP
jgi:DNA-binding beta-propeller fold protein YncE